jgi:hypothetical protein
MKKENVVHNGPENSPAVKVPGLFGGFKVFFNDSYVQYKDKRIFHNAVTSISFMSRLTSINLLPVSQSFSYNVASPNETIKISFGTSFYIGHKAKQNAYGEIIALSEKFIVPHLMKKMTDKIFGLGQPVVIGGVEFSNKGYTRTKFKLLGKGDKETVYWTDKIYTPVYDKGNVILWKDKDGKGKQFTSVMMSEPNAVIMPALVIECMTRARNG